MFVWDEKKREANLMKHGFDFADVSKGENMSASSRSAERLVKNDGSIVSRTDWERVRREIAADAPITYDPNDPDDGPYDPNDNAAVEAYWEKGRRRGLVTRGPGKRGPQKDPTKQLVSLRLSQEVLDHFRATGPGWQTRIDETLKRAVNK